MAAAGNAPRTVMIDPPSGTGSAATQSLLSAMLRADDQVSQLIFSPGRPPQIEVSGGLVAVQAPGLDLLSADDTRRLASDLIGQNKRLPAHLGDVSKLGEGLVLVTGTRGAGKSSILAALLDCINEHRTCHILTIEDPIEFLYTHKRATIHQRELHSDAPSFPMALRAAMHQAPKVILISELRDYETMEMALQAAETGHLVLSSVNSESAGKAVERIVYNFAPAEQPASRTRLARVLRYIICRKLVPRTDNSGRMAVVEILKGNSRAQGYEDDSQSIHAPLELNSEDAADGIQHIDGEIEKLVRSGVVNLSIALACAADPKQLHKRLAK
jgi:twitching motility protein PilT